MDAYEVIEIDDNQADFDLDTILRNFRCENIPVAREKMTRLLKEAEKLAQPAAVAILAPVSADSLADTQIRLGDAVFTSELLREKVDSLGRAFPFLATEGRALAEWADNLPKETDRYLARAIREVAVKGAQMALERKLCETFAIPVLSCMNPGSLIQWPIEEQEVLMNLLAPQAAKLKVTRLPSMLLDPGFSVSGVYFQTDKKYYNCQLCPRENCPNRKAKRQV